MTIKEIKNQIIKKKSFLCVGLDIDLDKIPVFFLKLEDPIYEFAKAIVDITAPYTVAYKPNLAFFEAYGPKGMNSLLKIMNYLNKNFPEIFTIADAKRGDIDNTSSRYAKAFFQIYNFDSITVTPYMGKDSIEPFLSFENKFAILLTLTSNIGSNDFQIKSLSNDNKISKMVYEDVIETSKKWKGSDRLMYVIGATQSKSLKSIRKLLPKAFFLIPGIGFQGGSLEEVASNSLNKEVGILVNSSRAIIYSFKNDYTFKNDVEDAAKEIQNKMHKILKNNNFL